MPKGTPDPHRGYSMTINVGIYVYNEVEVLDFAGPFEVFATASRVKSRMDPDTPPLFNVFTIGETMRPVSARAGLEIVPKYDIANHPKTDVLIIPGGIVSEEIEKAHLIAWIKKTSDLADIAASICTGAFLLAKSGLLQSKAATTHWEDIADFGAMFPDIQIKREVRWVDQGHVVTAAGISAGIDMSLHLVSRMDSRDLAIRTARQMDYDWAQNPSPEAAVEF